MSGDMKQINADVQTFSRTTCYLPQYWYNVVLELGLLHVVESSQEIMNIFAFAP